MTPLAPTQQTTSNSLTVTTPRRPRGPRAIRSERDFEAWVDYVTERADPFMAWLGILFALMLGYELAVPLSPDAARVLEIGGWAIWAIFVLEFLVKLWIAPRRLTFVRRHWLQAVALLVPTLRVLSFLRLLRLGRALPAARVAASSYRSAGVARRLVRSRLGYLGGLTAAVAIGVAELAYVFERDVPGGAFESFGDAVLWSLGVVIAMQGAPVPESLGAHVVMLAGFAFGLVVVASLAGTIGAFLVEERRERAGG